MSTASFRDTFMRRDRLLVASGLLLLACLAWLALVSLPMASLPAPSLPPGSLDKHLREMGRAALMPRLQGWGAFDFLLVFGMWAVMMVATMAPSVAPMLLMFATVNRRRREQDAPFVPTGLFLAGYLAVWTGFSLLAAAAQWLLHSAALLSPAMVSASPVLAGGLLAAAGVFQWTPLKHACLAHCRSPLGFLLTSWREGRGGAFRMGLQHGVFCVGCCWVLMGLLFVVGVMNLVWVAAIAGFVLLEKLLPRGLWLSRSTGILLAAWGVWVVAGA